jgi:hypothetical protein
MQGLNGWETFSKTLHQVPDESNHLDPLSEQHPLVSEALISISGRVRKYKAVCFLSTRSNKQSANLGMKKDE